MSVRRRLPPAATTAAPVWVIDRRTDLACLIGGALVAYAMLAAHVLLGVAAVTLYMAWVLAIDGPHVFATLSRTYLDREERAARARLLAGSLAFFALGPATVIAAGLVGHRLPYDLFLAVCTLWAYWHVVRQHYGVMVLYARKGGENDPVDARLDAVFLYVCLLAPAVAFVFLHERTLAMIGLHDPPRWAGRVSMLAWGLVALALLLLAGRQLTRWRRSRRVYWTKLLFLAAATSVSAVLFSPPVAANAEYEVIVPIVTSFHDVQYLAIVWFFHRNRTRARTAARQSPRPPLVARRLWAFLAAGLGFTLVYRVGIGCLASAWPGCDVGAQTIALPAGLTASDLGVAFLWGFALHHYYLDQRIWHVRREAAVGRHLGLGEAS